MRRLHTHTHVYNQATHLGPRIKPPFVFFSLPPLQGPVTFIDSRFYGRVVFPPLNLINYNLFRGGHNLYGTEPWTYYFVNGILNFNVVFLLGLAALPLLGMKVGMGGGYVCALQVSASHSIV